MGPVILPPTNITPIVQVAAQSTFAVDKKTYQSHLTPVIKAHNAIVYFYKGSAALTSRAINILDKQNRSASYRITGFASSMGAPSVNLALSLQRAKTVASFLRAQGVTVCSVKGQGAWPVLPYKKAQRVNIEVSVC